jgi:hypothetical protein
MTVSAYKYMLVLAYLCLYVSACIHSMYQCKRINLLSLYLRPFKEPRNRFPAWRVGTTTLHIVPARQAT